MSKKKKNRKKENVLKKIKEKIDFALYGDIKNIGNMTVRLLKLIFCIYLVFMVAYFWGRAVDRMFDPIIEVIMKFAVPLLIFLPIGLYQIKWMEIYEKKKKSKRKKRKKRKRRKNDR